MARTATGERVPGTSHNPKTTNRKPGITRTRAQREHDMAETARMHLQGMTQWQIAEQLNVSAVTICRDLKKLGQRWLEKADIDFDKKKAEELAKLDKVEATAWKAWEKSCQRKFEKGRKSREGGIKGSFDEDWEREEDRDGDPRFLDIVYKCILKRMEILGLDAPKKVVHTGPGGGPIKHEHTHETEQDREINRLLAGMGRLGEVGAPQPGECLPEGFKPAGRLDSGLADDK